MVDAEGDSPGTTTDKTIPAINATLPPPVFTAALATASSQTGR